MDIAAGNWGRNTKYQRVLAEPIRIIFGDWDKNGTVETIEAYFEPAMKKVVPWRDFETVAAAIPSIRERIGTYRAYGHSSVQELLGAEAPSASEVRANTLESMVFLNRGPRFEAKPLPIEAQFAPVFGLAVADFNGDGAEDLFVAQNFF